MNVTCEHVYYLVGHTGNKATYFTNTHFKLSLKWVLKSSYKKQVRNQEGRGLEEMT